ncbi:MAG: hypothetical protein R3C01_12955 [Planctomycetaceae bacterium]
MHRTTGIMVWGLVGLAGVIVAARGGDPTRPGIPSIEGGPYSTTGPRPVTVAESQGESQPPQSQATEPRRLPPGAKGAVQEEADAPSLMQMKLDSSRRVLNGLVTEDFEEIEAGADALLRTILAPERDRKAAAGDDKVYEHFRNEFGRLATDLKEMAQRRNLEGAAYLHSNLTANCIACHQHLRDSRNNIELLDGRHSFDRR